MGTLILIFIIVFIIWPVVKTFYRINKARKAARDMFNNAYGAGAGFGTQAQQSRKPGWSDAPARKKKITKDVGEYVSFQEIPADRKSVV